MLKNILNQYGLEKLNAFTKYPSIFTYHDLNKNGTLKSSLTDNMSFASFDPCYITEKIDGTNSRILIYGNDYIIGNREQFLFTKGDHFADTTMNIVKTVQEYAEALITEFSNTNYFYVFYGETYGGNITQASKYYSNDATIQYFRLFDYTIMSYAEVENIMSMPLSEIIKWRNTGNQNFQNVDNIQKVATQINLKTVPYIKTISGKNIPVNILETYLWLQQFATTIAGQIPTGKSEGIVIRSHNRKFIRKLRFEDYDHTKENGIF